jgi:hypothetical protein
MVFPQKASPTMGVFLHGEAPARSLAEPATPASSRAVNWGAPQLPLPW